MNKQQKAALLVVADMLATEMMKEATLDITSADTKSDVRDIFQIFGEDGAYELIDSLNEKVEVEMFRSFNKKARAYVKAHVHKKQH